MEGVYSLQDLFDLAAKIAPGALDLYLTSIQKERTEYSSNWLLKSEEDMAHHIRNFAECILSPNDASLLDYLSWLKVLFKELKFLDSAICNSFICAGNAARMYLNKNDADIFSKYVTKATLLYSEITAEKSRYIQEYVSGDSLQYVNLLVEGNKNAAHEFIKKLRQQGLSVKEIYLEVFQPAQRELGRLWQFKKISVAQEHYASATTQYLMSTMYDEVFMSSQRNGRHLIAACAQGELHEIGLRMVSDFFQIEGWDTRFFGANLPVSALVEEVKRIKPDIVALSATLQTNIHWISTAIKAVRELQGFKSQILVGGSPFVIDSQLYKTVGADLTASDCLSALTAVGK